ncbi:hypothetical protein DL771_009861 [Monosporascus sp. 5C6A]|nr:hypothetical protein DL771_009861 [Monosporascus sp. 5C6A]
MDESESDRDVVIQRYSTELVADFDQSLEPFLRKPNGQLRRRVRTRETTRLVSQVLEPFQELPQLLDPHLPKWLPVLAEAFLECLKDRQRSRSLSLRSQLLTPLSNAICRIIYTFCKIRGEKVIVRFLNVETRYLEPLLLAIEEAERRAETDVEQMTAASWTWHERYVVLLWLSQLLFAPFDLSTISSGDADDLDRPVVVGFQWPQQVPGIATRVIPLATKYLASPGKERDGAKALLVRLAMRRDMQEVGILKALVQWALSTLRPCKDEVKSPYYYIGSLAFLAGVLSSSADTSIMDPYLSEIFYTAQAVSTGEADEVLKVINGSALARKMLIKVVRSVVTLVLRKEDQSTVDTEITETSIGYFLEQLADNDTPVRFAASKALSVVTLKLEPDMASQVIEAVLESLNRNVLWVGNGANPSAPPTRDITAVDASEWHGLMLTLSHLLYRRAPPPENLSDIIHALLMGLSFEKRNPSGGSVGTNVRDASCFGVWALARRYSTAELLHVQTKSVLVARGHDKAASILQVIATELVVTASLDPAGNIRRGASAALQELIGRHPDTVEEGIAVVQTADYHTVALRARAIHQVALQATKLSIHYGRALLEATLGWRGIGDADANARRVAAASFGSLTAELARTGETDPIDRFNSSTELLLSSLKTLQARQVEERHGLLLSLAAVIDSLPLLLEAGKLLKSSQVSPLLNAIQEILQDSRNNKYRKPELIAEAVSRLVVSSSLIFLMRVIPEKEAASGARGLLPSGPAIVEEDAPQTAVIVAGSIDGLQSDRPAQLDELLITLSDLMTGWLDRDESEVVDASSRAALVLLIFSTPGSRASIIKGWCEKVSRTQTLRKSHGNGFFHAITRAYPLLTSLNQAGGESNSASKVLAGRWSIDKEIETRVAILESLIDRRVLKDNALDFLAIISDGLDDYTTTARGDIGSHVRLSAIKTAKTIWCSQIFNEETVTTLFPRILRLAAEKLDKVRVEAQSALALVLQPEYSESFKKMSFSCKGYFEFLFTLCNRERMRQAIAEYWAIAMADCMSILLAGLVTSADTGNEDLVIEARAALASYCEVSDENLWRVGMALLDNLKCYQGLDRVVVPTLEVVAFLFHVGLLQRCEDLNLKQLCLWVQKAGYKTGNVRKLEACIKVYSGIAAADSSPPSLTAASAPAHQTSSGDTKEIASELMQKRQDGIIEARRRLGTLMIHPWPRIRSQAVDMLWSLMSADADDEVQERTQQRRRQKLLGVDWGEADKTHIKEIVGELGLDA